MASSACSVHFLSLTTNNLSLSNSRSGAVPLPLTSASLAAPLKSLSVCSSFLRPYEALPSRIVRKVAFSSELDVSESNSPSPNFSPEHKLFVGNIPFTIDSATLAGLFETVGNVEVVEVIYDKMTGRSRGFGFVTMSTPQEAEAAANKFNGYELEGRAMRVNAGPPPPKGESSFGRGPRSGGGSFGNNNRLYVGNLAWGVDEAALETLFSEQGKVLEAKVVYDRETGRSRGFGFVTYSSGEEVNSAIEALNGVELNGRAIQVNVAESKPRRPF